MDSSSQNTISFDIDGPKFLDLACIQKQIPTIEYLLSIGVDAFYSIHQTIFRGDVDILSLLTRSERFVAPISNEQLLLLISDHHLDMIEYLLQYTDLALPVQLATDYYFTVEQCYPDSISIIKYLLQKGATINLELYANQIISNDWRETIQFLLARDVTDADLLATVTACSIYGDIEDLDLILPYAPLSFPSGMSQEVRQWLVDRHYIPGNQLMFTLFPQELKPLIGLALSY